MEYVHTKGILHRDIKPENLIFDHRGYLHLVDFGIARKSKPENARDTSGTPGYMSPEVIFGKNHSFESDYFSLGVICFELLLGRRPYRSRTRKIAREAMAAKQIKICRKDLEYFPLSKRGVDFVNKLLIRRPERRLGNNGVLELMRHPWMEDFPWRELKNGHVRAPYLPKPGSNHVTIKSKFIKNPVDIEALNSSLNKHGESDDPFQNYFYKRNRKNKAVIKLKKAKKSLPSIERGSRTERGNN